MFVTTSHVLLIQVVVATIVLLIDKLMLILTIASQVLPRHILANHAQLTLRIVRVLLDELLQQGYLLRWIGVERVSWHHVRGKHQDYVAIGHLFVIEGIYLCQ